MSDWCVKSINIIHTDRETSCLDTYILGHDIAFLPLNA